MKRWLVVVGVLLVGAAVAGIGWFAVLRGMRAGLEATLVPPTTLTPRISGIDTMTASDAISQLARLNVPVTEQSLLRFTEDGNEDFVRMLLLAGANPSAVDSFAGRSALHKAADHPGKVVILEGLLKAGANVNVQDKGGHTPLFSATTVRNRQGVRALLGAGADPWIRKNSGETALDYADDADIRVLLREAMKRPRPSAAPSP